MYRFNLKKRRTKKKVATMINSTVFMILFDKKENNGKVLRHTLYVGVDWEETVERGGGGVSYNPPPPLGYAPALNIPQILSK